jgi:cell wall-associated NlpC family hydrolase
MAGNSTSAYANANGYGLGAQAVAYAARFLGVKYVWGGESPSGFDCSGLVQYVYDHLGLKLPRTADIQYDKTQHITKDQLQPGDLVFSYWAGPKGANGVGHVMIYAGGGQMVGAHGNAVSYQALTPAYESHVIGYGRVPGIGTSGGAVVPADYQNAGSPIPGVDELASGLKGFAETVKNLALVVPFVVGGAALVVWGLAKATRGSE